MYSILPQLIIHKILSEECPVPNNLHSKLVECASQGVHKCRDICNYLKVTPLCFLTWLLKDATAAIYYREHKIKLRLNLLGTLVQVATDTDPSQKTASVAACKFLLTSLFKDSENSASLEMSQKMQNSRLQIEREKIRLSKDTFEFSKDSFLANMASRCDRQTMEKVKTVLDLYYEK